MTKEDIYPGMQFISIRKRDDPSQIFNVIRIIEYVSPHADDILLWSRTDCSTKYTISMTLRSFLQRVNSGRYIILKTHL